MSGITDLPCEIITSVLRHMGSLQNLSSALLACHHFYSSFKENPHVAVEIVEQQIGSLIPYAIATVEASCLEPRTVSAVQVLLDRLQRGLQAESQTKTSMLVATMPLKLLSKMSRTHDIIHAFVTAFANSAWTHLSVDLGEDLSLSPAEYFRFCRAFYRMELYFRLFSSDSDTDESGSAGAEFLRTMPPWENEQIGCAQDYLELQFSKASREVLAHDVSFGELSTDYITSGFMNFERQRWLAQGVRFVFQLINETSYDAKRTLLRSAFSADTTNLNEALTELYVGEDDNTTLDDYAEDKRAALFQPSDRHNDANKGPFEAWWIANKEMPLHGSVMSSGNSGYRERAYVLWDEDRLRRYNLLGSFAEVAPESELELEYSAVKYDAMIESFEARSKISQVGGSGYWSKGDESRIVW